MTAGGGDEFSFCAAPRGPGVMVAATLSAHAIGRDRNSLPAWVRAIALGHPISRDGTAELLVRPARVKDRTTDILDYPKTAKATAAVPVLSRGKLRAEKGDCALSLEICWNFRREGCR